MPGNPQASVFVGNLDDKVDERVLYEIMVQAGPLVDVYIPRDKETKRHKGYGFAEFTTEESAQYAVSLFTGLVALNNKSLRFSISGQDKQTCGPDKNSQEGKDFRPLEISSHVQRTYSSSQTPAESYYSPSVKNGYTGPGHRLNFSPLVNAHDYNARLVSLGQVRLRSQFPSQDYPYSHRPY